MENNTLKPQETSSVGLDKIKTTRTQSMFPADYWKAWVEGQEEEGPYGSGETEVEALQDLENLLEDEETK